MIRLDAPANGRMFENREVSTDADGKYEFKEVAAGRYSSPPQKAATSPIVRANQPERHASKPIEFLGGGGAPTRGLCAACGAVISGRIIDEFGEPLSNVQVSRCLQRADASSSTGRSVTTILGEFRLFGLMPGQVYIRATIRAVGSPSRLPTRIAAVTRRRTIRASLRQSGAKRIAVRARPGGQDLVFAMVPVATASVRGAWTDTHGKPMLGHDRSFSKRATLPAS